eukprot:5394019-Lingulodinium_polyedra.AAC.1
MDDLTVAFEAGGPESLFKDVSAALEVLRNFATSHGLTLNLSPGKTEAVVDLRGTGAKKLVAELEAGTADNGAPRILT